jgi:hypothetical protein
VFFPWMHCCKQGLLVHASCCFRNVGVHVTFDVNHPPPIHFTTKDTLRVSCRSLSCLEAPVVWGFGEGPDKGLVGKEVFPLQKILPGRRGQLQCDMGIEDKVSSKIWVD